MREIIIETQTVNKGQSARVVVPTRELHHGVLLEIEATAEMPE